MSLAKQGLLLIFVFLLYELGFIGVLAVLLARTEKEAVKQEFARDLSSKADRLMLILYDRGDAVGRYARSLQIGASDQADASVDEVTDLLRWLKNAFADKPDARALVEKIDQQVAICLPLHSEISQGQSNGKHFGHRVWEQKTEVVQPIVNQLVKELPLLVRMARSSDHLDVDDDRRKRHLTEQILVLGLLFNFVIVLAIAYLFSRKISSRLNILTDNTVRLKQGQELASRVTGSDEIATVDKVFHEMARALQEELSILKGNEQRVRALLENMPIGIVLLDTKGNIELVNASLEQTLKYSSHQLLGTRLQKLFASDQAVIAGAPHSQESQLAFKRSVDLMAVDAHSKEVPVEFSMSEVLLEGESKTLAIISDATEKYELEKMRQDFVAMVRMELKNPLTDTAKFLQKFGAGELGAVSEQCASTTKSMEQNIERLVVLLNDLFDLEKLEHGQIDIESKIVSANEVFVKAKTAVAHFALSRKVHLNFEDASLQIYADENRIVQVLVNLLSNAIKFSPANSVVEISIVKDSEFARIEVKDYGPGIPEEQCQLIFDPYKQVDGRDSNKDGTGLGLAICRTIVEAHGGQIGVTSRLGQGSTFWFQVLEHADHGGADAEN